MDVSDWLRSLGLGQYDTTFRDNGIDADVLLDLTEALSEQFFGPPLAVVAHGHEQPVPIFQQFARSDPTGRDDVREIPAVTAQR